MIKHYCDLCKGELNREEDIHVMTITRFEDDKPSLQAKDICVFCLEKLRAFLGTLTNDFFQSPPPEKNTNGS